MSAPIQLPDGATAGVVVVGADADMSSETVERLIVEVHQAAAAISQRHQHA